VKVAHSRPWMAPRWMATTSRTATPCVQEVDLWEAQKRGGHAGTHESARKQRGGGSESSGPWSERVEDDQRQPI
jgi:hypothetical protein